jgi:UDP-MurNAc hydroxylase
MKLKLYRSATVGINIGGFKILQDPWLTDGEYYGSWSHYPYYDLKSNLDEINSYNAIYISHIHPDHCSEETLKLIKKTMPVYIHNYHAKFLKLKLERLGYKVIELENGKRQQIARNVFINIFAADNCNPELCLKFNGCADLTANNSSQQIDTLSVIDDNKHVLVNVNDCPIELARSTFERIKNYYEKIDILLTGYGGAGSYPQCFENLNLKEKKISAKQKKKQFLNQAINYIKELNPDFFLPFAGTYTLTGKLSLLNPIRGVPLIDEAYDYFDKYLDETNINSKPIKINNEEIFDISIKENSRPYTKMDLNDYDNYILHNLKNRKLNYENISPSSFEEIYQLCKSAFLKYLDKKKINNINLDTDIYIKYNEKYIKLSKKNILEATHSSDFDSKSKYVIYETDPRLLKLLLQGPKYAHWNNAEIGSHLRFYRNPNIYERNVYGSMNYFHN